MQEDIRRILEIAVHAPSGHNFQPWRFEFKGDTLHLFNLPARDTTVFNFKQRGSFMAHGALLENIAITAPSSGLLPEITMFPEQNRNEHVAQIQFKRVPPQRHTLQEFITQRTTNRKGYRKSSLNKKQRMYLLRALSGMQGNLRFIGDSEKIKVLANAFSLNEKLLFQNKKMHQSLFPHITWSIQEAQTTPGLYIETFELPPTIKLMFRLFARWPVARFLGAIGFGNMVGKQNQAIYASCSAVGLISIPNHTPRDFVEAGRIIQRVWLIATKLGLSIQPVTPIIHLGERVREENPSWFSEKEKLQIIAAYKSIKDIFGITSETMAMTFRIGYSASPKTHSFYLKPEINFA